MDSSVDEKRETMKEPLLKNSPKGGLITMPFIIANGMLEKVASYGLMPNMTLYLMNQYHLEMTTTSNIMFYWLAAINFTPAVGAIIADSYLGRYNMIGLGSVLSLLGMILLWLTTVLPGVTPPPCNNQYCSSTTVPQFLLLCTSLAIIAIGGGGIRSSNLAFGVDQLENENDDHKKGGSLERFYSWYYATYVLALLIGYTCIVFIQEKMGWEFGFGVSVVLMLLAVLWFFLGTPFYVKAKAQANLITELIQVIVASFKKRNRASSTEKLDIIYHHKKGSTLVFPTEKLRFLNKACIIEAAEQELTPDGTARDPWSLCTVDQVEDLKAVLKVIPICSTGMITFINMNQGSFGVVQARSMNRKIFGNFEIPAGSFGTISMVCLLIWVPLYDQVIIPLISRIRGKPTNFSAKQRMGAGMFISVICVIVTAVVEGIRRSYANKNGLSEVAVDMTALWLVPQYCLIGIVEALVAVAQGEFFIMEFPKSMSSIASTLCLLGMSVGSILASFLMNTIDDLTKKGGHESWVSTNINKGHFDYYFWLLSGLGVVNFMYYLLCCWTHGPCKGEESKGRDEDVLV